MMENGKPRGRRQRTALTAALSRSTRRAGVTAGACWQPPPSRSFGHAQSAVVVAVLGHASSDTTQAYYLRFDIDRLRCCALDVEDVIAEARAGERDA